jgi:putative flavoprotein involved in K+ transport
LRNTLPHAAPRGFMVAPAEPPAEANGVTEAWIMFETAVGRGRGHVRLMGDIAWTFLTTMYELKRREEPQGRKRPKGVAHGADPNRTTWSERRQREAEELGITTQPYVVIVGGGQGWHRPGRAAAPARCPDDHRRAQRTTRRLVAQALQVALLHDPVWYRSCPSCRFRFTTRFASKTPSSTLAWRRRASCEHSPEVRRLARSAQATSRRR